jgi:hypothetical protein
VRRRASEAILFLFIAVAVAAGVVSLASAPDLPAWDDPPVSGDYQQVTLQVAGMT